MKIFCTASKDTYITDKIVDGVIRAEDANVGRAGTLDLFRLFNETMFNNSGSQDELSRLLVKFDYTKIHELTASKLDLSNFKATLKLFDIKAGNAVPANYNVVVMPLSRAFDEGVGRDVSSFNDLDASNYITASIINGSPSLWTVSGANSIGDMGSSTVDAYQRANFGDGNGLASVIGSQLFEKGTEDLSIDITKIVSASIVGLATNHGFRISFSGSDETDGKSRFVKRFASRHVSNPYLRPRIEVAFDDSLQDNHKNFFFDLSGSLFLNSFERSSVANLVSGSALTQITGTNSLYLKLKTGSYEYSTLASQVSMGTKDSQGASFVTGVYSASFAIPSNVSTVVDYGTTLEQMVIRTGSVTFDEYWYSLDGTVGFSTGSVTINKAQRTTGNWTTREPHIAITNLNGQYNQTDEPRLRIFGRDLVNEQNTPSKVPIKASSVIFDKVYYRIKNAKTDAVIIDFGESDNSTRVSTDSQGMFFDLHMDVLYPGAYTFEFLILERNQRHIFVDNKLIFVVSA